MSHAHQVTRFRFTPIIDLSSYNNFSLPLRCWPLGGKLWTMACEPLIFLPASRTDDVSPRPQTKSAPGMDRNIWNCIVNQCVCREFCQNAKLLSTEEALSPQRNHNSSMLVKGAFSPRRDIVLMRKYGMSNMFPLRSARHRLLCNRHSDICFFFSVIRISCRIYCPFCTVRLFGAYSFTGLRYTLFRVLFWQASHRLLTCGRREDLS